MPKRVTLQMIIDAHTKAEEVQPTPSVGLGSVAPDPVNILLGTNYMKFVSPFGIHGLAKENGNRVDILAVAATNEGTGQFSRFMKHLKETYTTICFWHVWNTQLAKVLAIYGFRIVTELHEGDQLTGWRWN